MKWKTWLIYILKKLDFIHYLFKIKYYILKIIILTYYYYSFLIKKNYKDVNVFMFLTYNKIVYFFNNLIKNYENVLISMFLAYSKFFYKKYIL